MSGYRCLHRESLFPNGAIWNFAASPLLKPSRSFATNDNDIVWRAYVACSDGMVRMYQVQETSLQSKQESLDASALRVQLSHILVGTAQQEYLQEQPPSHETTRQTTLLGCSQVSTVRNYQGDDDTAGDLVVLSMDMAGKIRIWTLDEHFDKDGTGRANTPTTETEALAKQMRAKTEFIVDKATGTTAVLLPPKLAGGITSTPGSKYNASVVAAAVGCLDGTVAIVSTGVMVPNKVQDAETSTDNKDADTTAQIQAGAVLEQWGNPGSAIPLSLCWHPKQTARLAVGRKDGIVDILSSVNSSKRTKHRLVRHKKPVRAVSYTDDGHLLITGDDNGLLCVWDTSHDATPVLVRHVISAHASWIVSVATLADSRRFVTAGADQKLHVWDLEHQQMQQPCHTFQTEHSIWTIHYYHPPQNETSLAASKSKRSGGRLISGSDSGWMQLYSVD